MYRADPQSSLDRYLDHDRNLTRAEFLNLDFQCPICLEIQKGRRCIQLEGCGHVFCQDCLKDFFSLMIREGTIDKVRCCHESCKGRQTEVEHPNGEDQSILSDELLGLVGPLLKLRYDELFEKQAIESDPTLCYCPMDSCRSLVKPDHTFDGSKSENLRVCSKCGYSFCFMCRKTWHGPTNQCTVPYLERMIEEYLNESSVHKRERMEKRLGGQERMRQLVRDYEENRANQDWKSAHTTACVNCFVPVEKIEGCNHMICARCQTHFCFRCGVKLSAIEPYLHYSKPQSKCFNRLMNLNEDLPHHHDLDRQAELVDHPPAHHDDLLNHLHFHFAD